MTFAQYSKACRILISSRLSEFIKDKKKEKLPAVFKEQHLLEELEIFALRGKLVRGTLFLLTLEMLGGKITPIHIDIACGIELMHSALLIQDDVIDRDYVRRGAPTVFATYEDKGKKIQAFDPYHYGVSSAFVAADVAFFFAIELISRFNSKNLSNLLAYYAHEIYLVSLAEGADSLFGQTKREASKEEIYAVYKYKTARYTFSLPFEMACIITESPTSTKNQLAELGEDMGILYQLKDDELGLFGNEKETGKPVGSDIREDKKTYIRHLLFKNATGQDKKILLELFGKTQATKKDIDAIKKMYKKLEIDLKLEKEIAQLSAKSKKSIEMLPLNLQLKPILSDLLNFIVTRKS